MSIAAEVQEKAEVKGALNADDQDILSAYSSEQGKLSTDPWIVGMLLSMVRL